jgi:hypothetical protein
VSRVLPRKHEGVPWQRVEKALRAGPLSLSQLKARLGMSPQTLYSALTLLIDAGDISRSNEVRDPTYRTTPK